jgi:hypothetical protein
MSQPAIAVLNLDRLTKITALYAGQHDPNGQMCAMEAVAYVFGEPWSDHPKCACPIISAFMRAWNDGLPDGERNALILPLIPRLGNTKGNKALEARRSLMATDWLVRIHAPAWLRLAGLTAHADALAGLPEITSLKQIPAIKPAIEAAQRDAATAGDATWDAANVTWAAAGAAAWDAARAAARAAAMAAAEAPRVARDTAIDAVGAVAWDAAGTAAIDAANVAWATANAAAWDAAGAAVIDAAEDAAGDAARAAVIDAAEDVAWDAARAAVGKKLASTKSKLQQSALLLIERMIAATA